MRVGCVSAIDLVMAALATRSASLGVSLRSGLSRAPGMSVRRRMLSLEPLSSKHRAFLSVVREHGHGQISLKTPAPPESLTGHESVRDHERGVCVVEIDNPASKNAISGRMMAQLADIVDRLTLNDDRDPAIDATSIVVLRGAVPEGSGTGGGGGSTFCSGADLGLVREVVRGGPEGEAMSRFMADATARLGGRLAALPGGGVDGRPQPAFVTFAHVNGHAIGELASPAHARNAIPTTLAYVALPRVALQVAGPSWRRAATSASWRRGPRCASCRLDSA
jgi:hypothetical protein